MSNNPRPRRPIIVGTVLFALLAILVSIQWSPKFRRIETDSGIFAYGGSLLLEGKLPYQAFWDHKPPGIYVINAVGLSLGKGIWGVWAIETLLFALSLGVLFAASCRALGLVPTSIGCLFILLGGRSNAVYVGGNFAESYVLILTNVLLAGVLYGSQSLLLWLAMGFLAAASFWLKVNCVGLAMAIGLVLLLRSIFALTDRPHRQLAGYCVGGIGTVLLVSLLMYQSGILQDFWDAVFTYNRLYQKYQVGEFSMRYLWEQLRYWDGFCLLSASLFVALVSLYRSFRSTILGEPVGNRYFATIVLLAVLLQMALLALPGDAHPQYFMSMIGLVGMGFALWCDTIMVVLRKAGCFEEQKRSWGLAALVLTACLFTGQIVLYEVLTVVGSLGVVRRSNDQEVLNYLAGQPLSAPLLMWGNGVAINFLSHRRAPSRYIYNFPLCPPEYDHQRRFDEFMEELKAHPDTIVIDMHTNELNALVAERNGGKVRTNALREVPRPSMTVLKEYIQRNYKRDKVFTNGWEGFVRVNDAAVGN